MPAGYFVFTSNVDGHFQKAGFDEKRIYECHGSISHLQCQQPCHEEIWQADATTFDIEMDTLRAVGHLPACQNCQQIARPNVLMFGDGHWLDTRSREQARRYTQWLRQVQGKNVVAIELGAGTSIPTVRYECEGRASRLIRINPREAEVRSGGISISSEALSALKSINELM
jgi:NAD-dependent SIR2 family protein deacetylase